jgi:hypothetical protein
MGYSIRTQRYRYTLWLRGAYRSARPLATATVEGVELYDYRRDPGETVNAAADRSYAKARARLHDHLVDYLGRHAGRDLTPPAAAHQGLPNRTDQGPGK